MLGLSLLYIILSSTVSYRRDLSILFNRIAIISLIYCILQEFLSLYLLNKGGIGIHGGLLHITSITQYLYIFMYSITILILQLTSFYPRKVWTKQFGYLKNFMNINFILPNTRFFNKKGEQFRIVDYPIIILFALNGAILLISTNDLFSAFLSIELQSYSLYLLSTIYRNSELSTIGGLTYFLLGGLSSCFILFGISLLYTNSGTSDLDSLYIINSINSIINDSWYKSYYIDFSLIILSIGLLFKIGAAPFHFWSPDVYDAIPTIVTTFVVIIAKISIFIFFLELIYYTNNSLLNDNFNWTLVLLTSSFLSLIIGTIGGLTQFRIKRLLAYSAITHVGVILLTLTINSIESVQAFIFYLIQYTISNLNIFIIILSIGYSLYYYVSNNNEYKELLDKNNSSIQLISQLKGYFYINPFLALSLTITIFSFAGIPPFAGFFAKMMTLSAALDNGYYFMSLIVILTSVISGVYYLNIVKEIFFQNSEYILNPKLEKWDFRRWHFKNDFFYTYFFKCKDIQINNYFSISISIITLIILLFIFMNKEWLSMGTIMVQLLFNY